MILREKSRDGLMTTVFTDHVRTSNKKQLGRKKLWDHKEISCHLGNNIDMPKHHIILKNKI